MAVININNFDPNFIKNPGTKEIEKLAVLLAGWIIGFLGHIYTLTHMANDRKAGIAYITQMAFWGTFLSLFFGAILTYIALYTGWITWNLILLAYVAVYPNVGALVFAFIQGFGPSIETIENTDQTSTLGYLLVGVVLSGPFTVMAALIIDNRRIKTLRAIQQTKKD